MKILKSVDVESWVYTEKCNDCDSELELDINDIEYDFDVSNQVDCYGFTCIVCDNVQDLNCLSLPKLIKLKSKLLSYDKK